MKKKKELSSKSNSGFSLITVILAVGLVGILVMLIAYMVIANFRMKMSGLKEKDAFYTAERALEEIRTGLQEDVAEAMSEAYTNVMESYNESVQASDVAMDVQRQAAYEREFLNILQKRLQGSKINSGYYDIDRLRGYVDLDKEDSFDNTKESLVVIASSEAGSSSDSASVDEAKMTTDRTRKNITLKNLKVIYVDPRGYAAIIRTNIQLSIPPIQYPTPSTLPDLMNMIVVAGKGIYCAPGNATSTQTGDNEIQGSVYAGILPEDKLKVNGQAVGVTDASIYLSTGRTLNISKGERTVCAGEVTLAQNSAFHSSAETTLWAQGVNLTSAKAELLGKTYLSDDLTIKAGTGSYVKLAGEYYGYGDVESALKSHNSVEYGYPDQTQDGSSTTQTPSTTKTYPKKSASALSSAITINGKSTTLDLSSLDRLLLAGKNYIASKALSKTGSEAGSTNIGNSDDVVTGESLTVKGTQIAYLVPDALLGTETANYHNPMNYSTYMEAAGIQTTGSGEDVQIADNAKEVQDKIKAFAKKIAKTDTPAKTLGNRTLNQIGVDKDEPIQTVFYNDGAGGYVYFYLNFTDEKKAADFMQTYYNNNPSLKRAMDGYLSFYFKGQDSFTHNTSGIYVKDPSAYLRYIVGGNVLSYNGEKQSGKLDAATAEETSQAVTEEETGYQNMWYALKRKMIGSYDLLKKEVKDSEGLSHDETAVDRDVFDNLVNEKEMVQFIEANTRTEGNITYNAAEKACIFTASDDDGGLQTIMAHNGKSSTFSVKEESASGTGGTSGSSGSSGGTTTGSSTSGTEQIKTKETTVQGADRELVIDEKRADKLRLVVCTGDVRIKAGVEFHGIIMAKGTITLEPGAKLLSSPLDAAKAFQSQVNNSGTSPKDFFWEGDKYVLGNSQTSNDDKNSDKDSSVYHVEDYVTYKNWKKL